MPYSNDQRFNDTFTNDIVSFEQLSPVQNQEQVQYNLNGSNPDGSKKQILRDFFTYFIVELYVVCTH